MTTNNRETWLIQAADIMATTILLPAIHRLGEQIAPLQYTVSLGHTHSKTSIGECWKKAASEDNTTSQIFITPVESNSTRILDILLHEMIHAADDCASGHKNFFARVARAVGLEGKFTATHAGDALQEKLLDIVDALGEIPHTALIAANNGKKTQAARMLKIECETCAFTFRASKTQLLRAFDGQSVCPCCAGDISKAIADQLHA
jgi:hypothetical protein